MNNYQNVIEVNNLTKFYGNVRGVEEISFTVDKGNIHGFLGPNGAGKTTTIRLLTGLLKPTYGEAKIYGFDAGSIKAKELIGYLPSDYELYRHYRVGEYLKYLAKLRNGAPLLNDLVSIFDLDLSRKTKELSRGNKQKVSIIQAFMHDPEIIIADEPTAGLDPLMQEVIVAESFSNFLELTYLVLWMIFFVLFSESITGASYDLLWELIALACLIPFYCFLILSLVAINLLFKKRGSIISGLFLLFIVLSYLISILNESFNTWYIKGIFALYNPVLIMQEKSIFVANNGIIILLISSLIVLLITIKLSSRFVWLNVIEKSSIKIQKNKS